MTGRTLAKRQGKSALQSTTNQAAAGLTIAVLADQLNEVLSLADRAGQTVSELSALNWQALVWPLAVSVLALALGTWIIRERMKKSTEDGV